MLDLEHFHISVSNIDEHEMHAEFYQLSEESAKKLNDTKEKGGRIIAVGTTSIRTLETIGRDNSGVLKQPASGWTDIFISPGYTFNTVDAFLTNFHLPKSTLLMLVSTLPEGVCFKCLWSLSVR